MKTSAYLFCALFLCIIAYFSIAATALAQGYQTNPYSIPNTNSDVPKNLHTWTQTVMIEVLSAATCQLIGIDPTNSNQKCLGVDPKSGTIGFVENGGGAIGVMGTMIAVLYTPPIHTGDFFNYLAGNFGFAKPAYAQSIGLTGLNPLFDLWKAFLNITYLFFVIVFIFIGFAIMLRVKIDPRTVMSIENQIPKIIVGLLLATFSLAIAGLLIDLMYVFIYLTFSIFSDPKVIQGRYYQDKVAATQKSFNGDNPLGVLNGIIGFREIVGAGATSTSTIVGNMFSEKPNPNDSSFVGWMSNAWTTMKNLGGAALTGIIHILAILIIAIALLWAMFRLWFELLKSYAYILVSTMLGPFFIVFGLIPGSPVGFGSWFRDLIANLSAFPVTIVMFLFATTFLDAFQRHKFTMFVPPLVGNPALQDEALGSLIALGIIFMTPQVVNMVKEMLKVPAFKYGGAIGQAVGVGASAPSRGVTGIASTFLSPHYNAQQQLVYPGGVWGRFLRGFGFTR